MKTWKLYVAFSGSNVGTDAKKYDELVGWLRNWGSVVALDGDERMIAFHVYVRSGLTKASASEMASMMQLTWATRIENRMHQGHEPIAGIGVSVDEEQVSL